MSYLKIKRVFDILFSLSCIPILLLLLVLLFIPLIILNRGKVFFRQIRPGFNGEFFQIVKLRTMNDLRCLNGELLPDRERIHFLGKFLRNTHIDELPQILNILKGEMSFVGPRPLLTSYLNVYTAQEKRRHCVKPGITGLAQCDIHFSGDLSEKVKIDLYYTQNISFMLDLKILLKTVMNILKV